MTSGKTAVNDTSVAHDEYPRLSRPPLREALVDIRLSESLPLSFVDTLRAQSPTGFVRVGDLKFGGFKLEVQSDRPPLLTSTPEEILGVRFDNADKSQALLLRRDGMTLSVLKNYESWQLLRDRAREFWRVFRDLSGPVVIGRLAVRYINVIDVPLGRDFDDYLTAVPRIPPKLPQLLTGFLQRVVVPFKDDAASAIITQALEPAVETTVPTVLDIDVSSMGSMDGASAEIWDKLERLRLIKNRIFFASLTRVGLELYQ